MPTPAEAVNAALQLHRQGDLPRAEAIYREVLQHDANNAAALHYLGLIEESKGNRDVAIELMRKSVAIKPEQSSAWNNLASALLERDRVAESTMAFERALSLKPAYPVALQNFARALQRGGRVEESLRASEAQLKLQPGNTDAIWNIELCRRELAAQNAPKRDHADRPSDGRWFTIIITCFGDHAQFSVRCLNSILLTPGLMDKCFVRVGCNVVCDETKRVAREHFDAGRITSLIESNVNLHKIPLVRSSFAITETPYVLIVDDDSHVRPGWLEAIVEFIERNHPFDVAGHIFSIPRDEELRALVQSRPWWKGIEAGHPAYREQVFFATGGFHLGRSEFLRAHDYPDPAVHVRQRAGAAPVRRPYEDVMLSEYANQVGGTLLRFPKSVMDHVAVNDGGTRGSSVDDRNPDVRPG